MLLTLQIATTFIVSIGWALALSHALEMPGKLRFNKEAYITAQTIYYPGFTIGAAVGEAGALVATLVLRAPACCIPGAAGHARDVLDHHSPGEQVLDA